MLSSIYADGRQIKVSYATRSPRGTVRVPKMRHARFLKD